MKSNRKVSRLVALALCIAVLFGLAAPAMAASVYAYGTVSADNTPVYSSTAKTATLGVFNKGDIVAIESQVGSLNLYVVRTSASSTSVGYMDKAAVTGVRTSLKSGTSVATLSGGSGTAATGGTPGVIANVSSYANLRATASASGKLLGTLNKGTAVTVLGTEGSFYKLTAAGKTGYVSTSYVSLTSTGTTPPAATTSTGTITGTGSTVAMRATASTSGSTVAKLSIGATVTIAGESGNFYKVTASGKTGYVPKANVKVSTSTGSATSGTPGVIANVTSYANFRATASNSGTLLGKLNKGTAVTVLGTEGSFYKVTASGKTGYVSTSYVSLSSSGGSTATPPAVTTGGTDTGAITVGKGGPEAIKVAPYQSTTASGIASKLAAAQKINSKTIGYISINSTNIQQPILYYGSKDVHYYATHNINNKSAAAGAVYAFYGQMARNNTITGHNMRGSNAMFHQLHHIQEKTLGYAKCQTTDYTCKGSVSSAPSLTVAANRTWDVSLFGYNKWEVWAMYETPANESTNTLKYNINPLSTYTPAQIKTWVAYQKGRSEVKFNVPISTDDIFLTVYTCGTNYDYTSAQSRIYFFLKAVK